MRYFELLTPHDLFCLWQACNNRGWFIIRRELLDSRLEPPFLWHRWSREQAASELDEMAADERLQQIDYWIDRFLKTDCSWTEILTTMTAWLDQRRSFDALRVVAAAVRYRGTREDLRVLQTYEGMPAARELIADTEFAVRRRSLR